MPEKKEREEGTPEANPRRIDLRALERGVRKALEIKPKDHKGKRQTKQGKKTSRPEGIEPSSESS